MSQAAMHAWDPKAQSPGVTVDPLAIDRLDQAAAADKTATMNPAAQNANEFTGERVIPGQVDDDLWAEHIARYAFAARFAAGRRVLDLGCGTGYGTAELARTARAATGVDVAASAVAYASEHYPGAHFLAMSATQLTLPDKSFDLVTSFELIEHLEDWQTMLAEANRVLDPQGLLIVSTPNKLYYAEARGESGPNPFHAHEFEYEEYRAALASVFPHVRILLQDRMESFGFYEPKGATRADGHIVRADGDPTQANFFVAICSQKPLPGTTAFLYIPSATNLLRERELHVAKLRGELSKVRGWLDSITTERDQLLTQFRDLQQHLEEQNEWASGLETDLQSVQARVAQLQDEFMAEQARATETVTAYQKHVVALEEDVQAKTEWALDRDKYLNTALDQLEQTVTLLDEAEATVTERTAWAQSLDAEAQYLSAQLDLVRQSRWVKLGSKVGLGPRLDAGMGDSAVVRQDDRGIPD
ncbi:MAG: methyltransferase domain-containing protein [Acidobacteriota bacterium]